MYLKDITIKNFRNYQEQTLTFSSGTNIIYGDNAQGKTNLLESIYVLGLTKSHRSFIDNNLINKDKEYAQIIGNIEINHIKTKLEIHLGKTMKKLKMDTNEVKKVGDYISKMNIIIFYPEDLELVKGSPAIRRRYLNMELSQLYKDYYTLLAEYMKILKIRNELLKKKSKNEKIDDNYFDIITNYFIDKAIKIYQLRNNFIIKMNEKVPIIYQKISEMSGFQIQYKTNIVLSNFNFETIKTQMEQKLNQLSKVEQKLGTTLVGPHRDELEFYLQDLNIKNYGSQGQQRMAVLSLKLAEIEIFKETTKENPILLLDDVFSELDDHKKNNLLFYMNDQIQTIITTTDLENIDMSIQKNANLIYIENGKIKNESEKITYGEE